MKAFVVLALLSTLISCGNGSKTSSSPAAPTEERKVADPVKEPFTDKLSILSSTTWPNNITLKVNGEEVFDMCLETPEYISFNRDMNILEMEFAGLAPNEKLNIVILDRGDDCAQVDKVFYVNERVDYQVFVNKWKKTRTVYARLNNYPLEGEEEEDDFQ